MLGRRDWLGSLIGLGVFAFGIFTLYGTFKLAEALFNRPSAQALGIEGAKEIDFKVAGTNLTGIIIQLLVLLIMALVGSLIAGKGVALYAGSLHPKEKDAPEPVERQNASIEPSTASVPVAPQTQQKSED